MKEKDMTLPVRQQSEMPENFKGYTLEELKYQRALLALKKEFSRSKIMQSFDAMRPHSGAKGKSSGFSSKLGLVRTIGSKVLGNLNTLDYVMLGISLFGTVKKAYSLFRRK